MRIKVNLFLIAIFSLGLLINGCTSTSDGSSKRTQLVVFGAGSLIIPFSDLEKSFEEKYPNIDVQAQYHGSIQVMRHATELHEPIDVVATADASLVPMLMYNITDPESGIPYADWYIKFGTNNLAIAYQKDSKYSSELTVENWFEILARADVRVGLADPRFDAVGYRALMVYALAGEYYHRPTIFTEMFNGQFTFPLGIFTDQGITIVTVPEILETKPRSHIVLRGASVELIALLESGDLDYAYEYESVIQQHMLSMFTLPDELSLGDAAYEGFYNTVEVDEDFQRFASVKPVFRGEQIGYGITIPSNAPHPDEAALFISYLLSPEGRAIMEKNSQPLFDPAIGVDYQNIPASLQQYCSP
ncbi:MAG: tungstate ABC transporter substrate-binding protein WtpA [Anaerolineales bacterium]|nr:tungstate ABC transporter substrate-binding protein WtpA [Anaerolineae bacterium]PWB55109.1 MAG: tungstate ABC transporter substrate-binding protein WtpA [Anaerolineales bacterium]